MPTHTRSSNIKPRTIIHGGAGNISRSTVPPDREKAYRASMLNIIASAHALLEQGHAALGVATHAVSLFEDDPLFNCGRGAVFTRAGTVELESSIMVSRGYRKRGVGCMLLKRVKHPIQLARELLIRGEEDDEKGGGAYAHSQLSGDELERLAVKWGLEMVDPKWFWTKRQWDEHRKGLQKEKGSRIAQFTAKSELEEPRFDDTDPSWDGQEYLPQGTVGAVVLDQYGTLCAATSTGGLTNKLPGRIGDTPTLGAGFWAEEWEDEGARHLMTYSPAVRPAPIDLIPGSRFSEAVRDCLPALFPMQRSFRRISDTELGGSQYHDVAKRKHKIRAVAMSGTGNGDSFLRVAAVRTAAAMTRFSAGGLPLATAVTRVAGPCGELQRSAENRWGKSGEGEGGIIGIELVTGKGNVVWDFNCGGMFRAYVDDEGKPQWMVFRDV